MTTSKKTNPTPTPTQIREGIESEASSIEQESKQIVSDISSATSSDHNQLKADAGQTPKNCCAITNQCTTPNYASQVTEGWNCGIVAISASSLKNATASDSSLNIGYQAQTLQALPFCNSNEVTVLEQQANNPQIQQYFLGSPSMS